MNLHVASRWAAAAVAALSLAGCEKNNGTGQANGYVTVTTHSGFWCQTYEGEMALGNIRSARTSGGSSLDFNVQDPKIFAQLQKAQNDQTPVHLDFHQVAIHNWCGGVASDVIDKVTPMNAAIVSPFGKVSVGTVVGNADGDATEGASAPSAPGVRERVLLACDPKGCKLIPTPKG